MSIRPLRQKREKNVKSSKESLQEIDKLQSELHSSIHFDFTDQVKEVMAKHAEHCKLLDRRVSLRQYMWDLFAVTMIMHITDSIVTRKDLDYPNDKYTDMTGDEMIVLARDTLDNIITGKHDKKLISEEQEDISVYEFTNSQKLLYILKAAYMSSIAFLKLRNLEDLFVPPETKED